MSVTIIAELATGHGGDVELACDMVRAAADAGADYAKIQTYDLATLNPKDPQREWLTKAHLDKAAHERIMRACEDAGIQFLSTPCDAGSLQMLRDLGQKTFKIASSESGNDWWEPGPKGQERWFVSFPWGQISTLPLFPRWDARLTAIPLYPTPLEAVGRATLLDGWSDHCVGIAACRWAMAQGAKVIEAHLTLPERSRKMPFDKTPSEFRALRDFADACATIQTGVSQTFRDRWRA